MAASKTQNQGLPWLSLGLFCLAYGVFGWLVGSMVPTWESWILDHRAFFFWPINPAIASGMAWSLGGLAVLLLMLILVAPLHLMHLLFGSWLRSDANAFVSVLTWAFVAVLLISWLEEFIRFFVLLSAGMLCHLDLQLRGARLWQVFIILTGLGLGSFAVGGYCFLHWPGAIALWESPFFTRLNALWS